MKRYLPPLLLLLLVIGLASAERVPAQFRLRKDPNSPMRGFITAFNDEGFTFEKFRGGKSTVRWDDLVKEDAQTLRIRFKLEQTEAERLGLVPGHELRLKGTEPVRGYLERIDEDGKHWLRVGGLLHAYPKDRIEKVIETKVPEGDIYSPDEVYARRLQRTPPTNAMEHRRLADYLYDIGSWDGADKHYRMAMAKDPALRQKLEERLAELKAYQEDAASATVLKKASKMGNLDGKYSDAILMIRDFVEANPGAARRGQQVIERLEQRQFEKKNALFHRIKNEELDRTIRRFLARSKPGIDESKSWVLSSLEKELRERIKARLELTPEEWDLFKESPAKGAPHWATYRDGTFVVDKRAKVGKSSKRAIRGDPNTWWRGGATTTQTTWMKAFAAERLKIFEVVMVRNSHCTRCGGTGRVKKGSVNALEDGRHEWKETCPRCYGAGEDRAVAYK